MPALKAVCFDLDDTLLDGSWSAEAIARTCNDMAACCPGVLADTLQKANAGVWLNYWPEIEERWTLGRLTGESASREAWRRTLVACGVKDDAMCRLAFDTHARYAREGRRLFDDALDVLERLSGRLRLAVITNGAADTQREKLDTTGIAGRFDLIVMSGEHGVAKPATEIFDIALKGLGVAADEALHVGDNLRMDVAGAVNAGLMAVWLNRRGLHRDPSDPAPHHEITSLSELTRITQNCMTSCESA